MTDYGIQVADEEDGTSRQRKVSFQVEDNVMSDRITDELLSNHATVDTLNKRRPSVVQTFLQAQPLGRIFAFFASLFMLYAVFAGSMFYLHSKPPAGSHPHGEVQAEVPVSRVAPSQLLSLRDFTSTDIHGIRSGRLESIIEETGLHNMDIMSRLGYACATSWIDLVDEVHQTKREYSNILTLRTGANYLNVHVIEKSSSLHVVMSAIRFKRAAPSRVFSDWVVFSHHDGTYNASVREEAYCIQELYE